MQLLFTVFQLAACRNVRGITQCSCHNAAAAAGANSLEQMMHTKHEVCNLFSQPLKQPTVMGQMLEGS